MSKILFICFVFISLFGFSQSPQSFKYQAVVRNSSGVLLFNQIVSIRSSILQSSSNGAVVYSETQTLSTNEYGVVALNIGEGTLVSGSFSSISWGTTSFFVKTELDIMGGSNFQFMGTSQIMSVPYALFAEKSKSSTNDLDTSATNEIQSLNLNGNNLSISNGNTIVLPPDNDADPTNENQSLQIVGDSLKISNGNSVFLSGSIDLDASPTNELQLLSRNGDTLFLSNGNFVLFNDDFDKDSLNELQTLTNTVGTISITNGNTIVLADSSVTNEIQNLSINQGTISISNSNSINLPDSSSTNELQTLSIVGDSLQISNGNKVKIKTNEHYFGELWGGGIIYHVFKDSLGAQHGLIMSRTDIGGSFSPFIDNPSDSCSNYIFTDNSGTYSDWEFPNSEELKLMILSSINLLFIVPNFSFSGRYMQSDGGSAYFLDNTYWRINGVAINGQSSYEVRAIRRF